jgi:hypothetical protein
MRTKIWPQNVPRYTRVLKQLCTSTQLYLYLCIIVPLYSSTKFSTGILISKIYSPSLLTTRGTNDYTAFPTIIPRRGVSQLTGEKKLTTGNTRTQVQCRCINLYCSNFPPYYMDGVTLWSLRVLCFSAKLTEESTTAQVDTCTVYLKKVPEYRYASALTA